MFSPYPDLSHPTISENDGIRGSMYALRAARDALIRAQWQNGEGLADIARDHSLSVNLISSIVIEGGQSSARITARADTSPDKGEILHRAEMAATSERFVTRLCKEALRIGRCFEGWTQEQFMDECRARGVVRL